MAGGAVALTAGLAFAPTPANAVSTNITLIGAVEQLTRDTPGDRYSGGTIVVGGQTVILPRNLVIELPANFLTLNEIFEQAPGNCANVESGLSLADTCNGRSTSAVATILANRLTDGRVIAGDVFIERGQETLTGIVTFVHHTFGYMRIGGTMGQDVGGTILRINDPTARHSIQGGPGCVPVLGNVDNCSPDARFTIDSDNYTITFATGYPACIPSTRFAGNLAGDPRTVNRTGRSNAAGRNDPFCPHRNRTVNGGQPVENSHFFAPIQVGDHLTAEGSTEMVRGTKFMTAHTVVVHVGLTTAAGQPDYVIFDEAEWDTAGYQNARVRMLMIGFSTLLPTEVEVYALDKDLATGENVERIIASSQGCEAAEGLGTCINQGIGPVGAGGLNGGAGIWRIRYDVDFILGVNAPKRSPCGHLNAADPVFVTTPCPPNFTLADEVSVIIPNTHEIIARSRNKVANPLDLSTDLTGAPAPNGEYLTPIGATFPEFVEINLNAIQTPFIFEGQTWNLDRRNHPVGCAEGVSCLNDTDVQLTPFPLSCLDPAGQTNATPPGGINFFRNLIVTPRNGSGPLPIPTAGCP